MKGARDIDRRGIIPPLHLLRRVWEAIKLPLEIGIDIAFAALGYHLGKYLVAPSHPLFELMALLLAVLGFFAPILLKSYWLLLRSSQLMSEERIKQFENIKEFHGVHGELLHQIRDTLDLYITPGFSEYLKAFEAWKSKISVTVSSRPHDKTFEEHAWTLFTKTYFKDECQKVHDEYVLTNTRCFTELYWAATNHLVSLRDSKGQKGENKRVLRFHITGMLPEEFYNGPQIEYLSVKPKPIFFAHKWEDYNAFYNFGNPNRDGVVEQRCIIVRDMDVERPPLGALANINLLQEQTRLVIGPSERLVGVDLRRDCPGVIERLFMAHRHEDSPASAVSLLDGLLNKDKYNYTPIHNPNICGGNNGCELGPKWSSLLERFIRDYHSSEDDALYCTIDRDVWSDIERRKHLRDCFRPGWAPEIVLFGDPDKRYWYFGFLGRYRLFTPDIELTFLSSSRAADLYADFMQYVCVPKGKSVGRLTDLCGPELVAFKCAGLKATQTPA